MVLRLGLSLREGFLEEVIENNDPDFPGGPVVKTLCFQCRGCGINSWSGNLRSHMLHDVAKKNKIKRMTKANQAKWPLGWGEDRIPGSYISG